MENNTEPKQKEHGRNSNTYVLQAVLVAAVVATGTGIAVKACLTKDDKDDKPKIEEKAPAEESAVKPILPSPDAPRFVMTAVAPDAGVASADDASQAPPDVSELTIKQACQELKSVTEEDDSTVIYPLLKNIMGLLENDIAMESGNESFRKVAEACNFSEKQLLNILKIAISQGDTRVADLVNDLIKKKCRDKTDELTTRHFQEWMEGMKGCGQLPAEDMDGRRACIDQAAAKREQKRQEAKDFADNQCPSETAADLGLDQDKIEALAALKYANELFTGRIVLVNPNTAPSKDDIKAYMMALRPLVVHLNEPAILEALGIKNEAEFKTKYFDEVSDSLKKREGELYQRSAHALETLYGLKEVLGNF